MIRGLLVIFYLFIGIFALFVPVEAINMSSDSYKIQWGNVNLGSGRTTASSYQLDTTLGQIAPGRYAANGYLLRAGFQYIHSLIPFSFTISNLTIDFGSLIPNEPALASNVLTVRAGGAGGYQVLAFENHPLRSNQGAEIADVSGDNHDCSETHAGLWQQNTSLGFGFNMSGDDIPADFLNSNYYRQFANRAAGESAVVIMGNDGVVNQAVATVHYKVVVGGSQPAGHYENAITFVAVPSY